MTEPSQTGRVVVVSGPSGSGKTTVLKRLMSECPAPLVFSVSATTRHPRVGEIDGENYHFLTLEEFHRRREAGEFLECFEVFRQGHWYGTLWSEVAARLSEGKWVVLDVDVNGMQAVTARFPEATTIFVVPGDMEELERRLRTRNTESNAEIEHRLLAARREMEFAGHYQHVVLNDVAERAAREICQLLQSPLEGDAPPSHSS